MKSRKCQVIFASIVIAFSIGACSPSPEELTATVVAQNENRTQIAADVFATQTAEASMPKPTNTHQPTSTQPSTPTATLPSKPNENQLSILDLDLTPVSTFTPQSPPKEQQLPTLDLNLNPVPSRTPQSPPKENQLGPIEVATSTAAPTPTITPTPTAVPIPTNFSVYHSAEFMTEVNLDIIPFSVSYPTDWVTGWLVDSGVTAFTIMSDPDAWKHISGLSVLIALARASEVDLQDYKDSFRGWSGDMIGEATVNGLRLIETVFNDRQVLQLSAIIEGEDPTEGLVVAANLPLSAETLYRPLMEQIITSIKVH